MTPRGPKVTVIVTTPLAGHQGSCAKVTTATVTGKDVACTCGKDKSTT